MTAVEGTSIKRAIQKDCQARSLDFTVKVYFSFRKRCAQVEAIVSQSDVVRLLVQHAPKLGGPFSKSLASLGLGTVSMSP